MPSRGPLVDHRARALPGGRYLGYPYSTTSLTLVSRRPRLSGGHWGGPAFAPLHDWSPCAAVTVRLRAAQARFLRRACCVPELCCIASIRRSLIPRPVACTFIGRTSVGQTIGPIACGRPTLSPRDAPDGRKAPYAPCQTSVGVACSAPSRDTRESHAPPQCRASNHVHLGTNATLLSHSVSLAARISDIPTWPHWQEEARRLNHGLSLLRVCIQSIYAQNTEANGLHISIRERCPSSEQQHYGPQVFVGLARLHTHG
ncbi:hypothetical protein OH76DRAFT_281090 [Lentinus brumalis]|uniref:Uncharacterized protein n=1 Tax=Lentinus brumalis TaxID=2498619 RepID=A0A371CKU8_9APHY|nr:hypothetical protein OH76DRAFT_281090 [Polyporus brumalis]